MSRKKQKPQLRKSYENIISQKLENINSSIKQIKQPSKLEKAMFCVVIISALLSLAALLISANQFNIYKYEKEPRIVHSETKCETPDEYLGKSITLTLTNFGLTTVYDLKITTNGFKCIKKLYGYSTYSPSDYDKYNETNCYVSYVIGPDDQQSFNFFLIVNKSYNGTFVYNIDYEYSTFSGKQGIHVISCEFEKKGGVFFLTRQY